MATNTKINGNEYFKITRTIGYKYVDGKRVPIKKQFYGSSKRNAELKYELWKSKQDSRSIDPMRLTSDLAEEYNTVLALDDSFAESTRKLYIASYKANFSDMRIENIPIGQLSHQHIQEAYIRFNKSADSLRTFNNWMKNFLVYCRKLGYCQDILSLVTIPQKEKIRQSDDIVVWSDKEIAQIKRKLREHRYYPCIMLSLYAGLREGEILGLKWEDIKDGSINIKRQYERGSIVPPKYNSVRTIPMHKCIEESLKEYPHNGEYIFVTASGKNVDASNFRTGLKRAYASANIPYKKFHSFRATFCTNLCRKGVPIQTASKLLGHKNINTTAKFYSRIQQDEMLDAISLL